MPPVFWKNQASQNLSRPILSDVIPPRMYLSIWFGVILTSQTGCSLFQKKPEVASTAPGAIEAAAEVRKPLAANAPTVGQIMRANTPSSLPKVPPAGVRVSYNSVQTDQMVLAMTFDDGPHPSLTPNLLDILKARNIKATFFVIGKNARTYPHIIRRILAEGHEIGNHTYTHCSLTSRSDDQIRKELQQSEDALALAGCRPHFVRPPYGAVNSRIKNMMYSDFGYSTIMWSVDPQDWRRPGVSVVTSRLVNGAHKGAILLAHDIHPPTIQAMPATFDQLLAKGYQFVTVSQLMNLEKANNPLGVVIKQTSPADASPEPVAQ